MYIRFAAKHLATDWETRNNPVPVRRYSAANP